MMRNVYRYTACLLIGGLIVTACKTTRSPTGTTGSVRQGQGVYQYSEEGALTKPFYSDRKGVIGRNGMVASAHPEASQVGLAILQAGGNAVDAAGAVQFALAVVYPNAGNIGGGGFMVYRDRDGKAYTLDYREKAPGQATANMYLDSAGNVRPGLSTSGPLASGVPGSVDGMVEAHKRFGKLPWSQVLQPAVDLATNGYALTERDATGLNRIKKELLTINPGKTYFLKSATTQDTTGWHKGDKLVQADLARTMQRIQQQGRAGFYEGETARLLT
ncbi:MAG: gamma-glutamyltransferase, partial [Oxalobacteraceae bacterium]